MSRAIPSILTIILLLTSAVPQTRAEQFGRGRDQVWRLRITEVFREYDPTPDKKADPLYLHITFTDPLGRLLESATVSLRFKDNDEEPFEPVRPGIFSIELSRSLRKKGGMLEMRVEDYWGLVETHIRSRAEGIENPGPLTPEILSTEGMSVITGDRHGGEVFYSTEEQLPHARKALDLMERAFPVMREILGADPAQPFSVVVTSRTAPQVMEQLGRWPYPYNRQSYDRFAEETIRAWAHTTLEGLVNLHADRRNRWVSTGIVGYVTHRVLATLEEDGALTGRLDSLLESVDAVPVGPRPTYNLTGFTWPLARGFVEGKSLDPDRFVEPGYGISLALFLKLSRRHGDDFVRRLIQSTASMREGARTNPNIIDVVDALSGESYKLEIRSFSLLEAKEFLVAQRDDAAARSGGE
jgi:hypothetical protein